MWKFVIRENEQEEIDYILKTDSGRVILHSRNYASDNACRKGIASVTRNSRTKNFEDCTVKKSGKFIKHPKYEIYGESEGEFKFRLKASNGQVVGTSSGYSTKEACLADIEELRKHGSSAIVDY